MWTRLYGQSKVWLRENILYAVTYSYLIAVSCSFLLFCRKKFCLQLLEELLSCLACWNVPQMCSCDPRFMFKPFHFVLQSKKKKASHLIYIPQICHLCPLDHIITANLICQRFTYHSTSLWWDCGFRQVRLLAYFLLRWKLRLLSALDKVSWQKRKVERWKGWTLGIIMQNDDCTSEFALCGKCSGRHAFCMMLHAHIVKG